MNTLITFAIIAEVLNVLDSVSTEIGLYRLPEHLRFNEANPISENKNSLMHPRNPIGIAIKHSLVIGLGIWAILSNELKGIRGVALLLGITVFSNLYYILGVVFFKKKVSGLYEYLYKVLAITDKGKRGYVVILTIVCLTLIIERIWEWLG